MKVNLNEDGSQYIKATFMNQVWLRYNESNPGTLVNEAPQNNTFDIGVRRLRMQLFGQLTERIFFYTQFGMNNFSHLSQNARNRKLQAFFHDALGEYKVFRNSNYLKLGAGLTIATGLSRFSQPSVGTIMSLDVPVFAQTTVDQTDEFGRKLSLYARGQIGHLDYRTALSDPFPIETNGATPAAISEQASFSGRGSNKQYSGLLIWNFWESEPHTTPYMTGTYHGKKKIFNLEMGVITQKNATWSSNNVDTSYYDMLHWSVAWFLDAPVNKEKGNAVSTYLGYFSTDYGKNYIRNNGIMNPANGANSLASYSGAGNAYPMFKTGKVIYFQTGYKFRDDLLGKQGTLMPYFTLNNSTYDNLEDQVIVFDAGINWLMQGHLGKLSLDFQNRPTFEYNQNSELVSSQRKSALIMQYQILF